MRLSRQTALALAIMLGFLAVLLAYTYLRNRQPPVEVVQRVQLPVPMQDIPADVDLRRDMFHQLTFDVDQVPRDAITDPDRLHGRITLWELPKDKPVSASAVAVRSAALGLSYGIPEDRRAMAIPVDDVSGVANMIRAGDYVDVLAIFHDDTGKLSVVQTVLQDLEVLAINGSPTGNGIKNGNGSVQEGEGEKPAARRGEDAKTVTLAVTAHEAQILALSHTRGQLRLTLRRTGDRDIVALGRSQSWSLIGSFPTVKPREEPTPPAPEPPPMQPGTWAEMWGGPPMPAPSAAPAAPAPPKEPAVEVIRGSAREFIKPVE